MTTTSVLCNNVNSPIETVTSSYIPYHLRRFASKKTFSAWSCIFFYSFLDDVMCMSYVFTLISYYVSRYSNFRFFELLLALHTAVTCYRCHGNFINEYRTRKRISNDPVFLTICFQFGGSILFSSGYWEIKFALKPVKLLFSRLPMKIILDDFTIVENPFFPCLALISLLRNAQSCPILHIFFKFL